MNYDKLTASFISIIQTVSSNKEIVGASMTVNEILESYLDDLDFEMAILCFEAENRVVFQIPAELPEKEFAGMSLRAAVQLCVSDKNSRLKDPQFVTHQFVLFKDMVLEVLKRMAQNKRDRRRLELRKRKGKA